MEALAHILACVALTTLDVDADVDAHDGSKATNVISRGAYKKRPKGKTTKTWRRGKSSPVGEKPMLQTHSTRKGQTAYDEAIDLDTCCHTDYESSGYATICPVEFLDSSVKTVAIRTDDGRFCVVSCDDIAYLLSPADFKDAIIKNTEKYVKTDTTFGMEEIYSCVRLRDFLVEKRVWRYVAEEIQNVFGLCYRSPYDRMEYEVMFQRITENYLEQPCLTSSLFYSLPHTKNRELYDITRCLFKPDEEGTLQPSETFLKGLQLGCHRVWGK